MGIYYSFYNADARRSLDCGKIRWTISRLLDGGEEEFSRARISDITPEDCRRNVLEWMDRHGIATVQVWGDEWDEEPPWSSQDGWVHE